MDGRDFETELAKIYAELAGRQERLGDDFARAIYHDRESLYATDDPPTPKLRK
jgi:hypothetical protein